jgi:hypothetical protein
VSLTVRHLFFTPLYSAHILGQPYKTFYRGVPTFVLATMVTLGLCRLLLTRWEISNWFELGAAATLVSLAFLFITYVLLNPQERSELKETLTRRVKTSNAAA